MSESDVIGYCRPVAGGALSVLGRRWVERCDAQQAALAVAMAQRYGIAEILARVLAGRGVELDAVENFLEPRLRDLMPDPFVLRDMEQAVERLAMAVEKREKVAIFGDYDVDGACSAALLAEFLSQCGVPHIIHIPDRLTEGYGPNTEAIRGLKEQGAQLLVTVDCGTSGHEPIAEAVRLGLDVVVLDHHQAPEQLPAALALVNPNRQDDLSGLGYLCAAGVVFLTLVALHRILRQRGYWNGAEPPNLMAALDLVALATVADVVPLTGLNRAFVRQGLAVMRNRSRPGLAALADASGLKDSPEAWHLGYLIGPRINAGGRIGDSGLGARLLLTGEAENAARLAGELDFLNRERQQIEQVAVEEAVAAAERCLEANPRAVFVQGYSPQWHAGVVGLVAARLKERFGLPSFAFTLTGGGLATGSGRSVPGFDIGAAVRAAVEAGLAVKGGGHAMAAGATVPETGLDAFRGFMESYAAAHGRGGGGNDLAIDAPLTAGGATPDLMKLVNKAGPFGSGQPEPVFAFANHRLVEAREVGSGGHVRIKLRAGDGATIGGIAFRAAGQPLGIALQRATGGLIHACGTLSLDRWGGTEKVDLRLTDIIKPE